MALDEAKAIGMRRLLKSRRLRLVLVAVLACVVILGIVAAVVMLPANRLRNQFGWQNVDVVEQADQVAIYHINGSYEYIIGKPVIASPDLAHRIQTIVSDPKSYSWDFRYECLPNYNVLVQFRRGTEKVNAYFCFDCDEAAIGDANANNYMAFNPVRNHMLSLIKKILPGDAAIQSIQMRIER